MIPLPSATRHESRRSLPLPPCPWPCSLRHGTGRLPCGDLMCCRTLKFLAYGLIEVLTGHADMPFDGCGSPKSCDGSAVLQDAAGARMPVAGRPCPKRPTRARLNDAAFDVVRRIRGLKISSALSDANLDAFLARAPPPPAGTCCVKHAHVSQTLLA
jgi:hypothetical protein